MSIRNHHLSWMIAITVLILSSCSPSAGQHTAALKMHTFRAPDGLFTIGYEQALNERVSVELSLQGGHYVDFQPNRWEDYEVRGIGAIGAFRYFPVSKNIGAPRGFFTYAALRYIYLNETFRYTASQTKYEVGGNLVNAGLGIGYKVAYRRLGLEAFVGWGIGQLRSVDDAYRNNIPEFFQSSIEEQEHFPQLDVAICYMLSPSSKD
jgi:hypothetical protein